MLNDAILVVSSLVWNPLWFRLTTGIIWAQVWKFERFGACFRTCALIIWSVLLHLSANFFLGLELQSDSPLSTFFFDLKIDSILFFSFLQAQWLSRSVVALTARVRALARHGLVRVSFSLPSRNQSGHLLLYFPFYCSFLSPPDPTSGS
jgi:hypothetical protein